MADPALLNPELPGSEPHSVRTALESVLHRYALSFVTGHAMVRQLPTGDAALDWHGPSPSAGLKLVPTTSLLPAHIVVIGSRIASLDQLEAEARAALAVCHTQEFLMVLRVSSALLSSLMADAALNTVDSLTDTLSAVLGHRALVVSAVRIDDSLLLAVRLFPCA